MSNDSDATRKPRAGRRFSRRMAMVMTVAAGLSLTWLVLTRSLPFALAESHPELAHWLHRGNPAALVTLAERARVQFLARPAPPANAPIQPGKAESVAAIEGGSQLTEEQAAAKAQLRIRIEALALAAIAADSLNAGAFRLLGEMADAPDRKRSHMQEAVSRSRRESIALFWLMADSFERRDFQGVIEKADIVLRTGAVSAPEALRYLAAMAETPEARAGLAAALARNPAWRRGFFETLPKTIQVAGAPFELFLLLNESGTPVTVSEAAPYLDLLMRENMASYAHDIWLQLAINRGRETAPTLNNAGFTSAPSGLPFDWALKRGGNSTVEFRPLANGGENAVVYSFDHARVQFPELSQVLVLDPGRYELRGELRGSIKSARGLRWEVGCLKGKVLAQTDMLFGSPKEAWSPFALEIAVPDLPNCQAQTLRLYHHARSASEQMISGQIAFRHLAVSPIGKDGS